MARYVDGFLVPVPKKNIEAYRRMSAKAGKVWRDDGALEYRECVAEDLKNTFGVPFTRAARPKAGGDGRVFLDRLQVARAQGPREREGHEGPSPRHGPEGDALRRQTHGLRWLRGDRRPVITRVSTGVKEIRNYVGKQKYLSSWSPVPGPYFVCVTVNVRPAIVSVPVRRLGLIAPTV